jgi:predicted acetyltransferase
MHHYFWNIKNIRDSYTGISDFKKGYQARNNIVKDEKRDLVTDCHCILARWRKHFSQLLWCA